MAPAVVTAAIAGADHDLLARHVAAMTDDHLLARDVAALLDHDFLARHAAVIALDLHLHVGLGERGCGVGGRAEHQRGSGGGRECKHSHDFPPWMARSAERGSRSITAATQGTAIGSP